MTDKVYGIAAVYYADYYEAGTVNWVFTVYNEDYFNDGDAAMLYNFDVSLPKEYDFFKLQADGIPEGVYTFNDSLEGFTFNSNSQITDYVIQDYVANWWCSTFSTYTHYIYNISSWVCSVFTLSILLS